MKERRVPVLTTGTGNTQHFHLLWKNCLSIVECSLGGIVKPGVPCFHGQVVSRQNNLGSSDTLPRIWILSGLKKSLQKPDVIVVVVGSQPLIILGFFDFCPFQGFFFVCLLVLFCFLPPFNSVGYLMCPDIYIFFFCPS